MNKTNIVLILLATTALLTGVTLLTEKESKQNNFLSLSLTSGQDPCSTIVYRSDEDFNKLLK